MINGTKLLNVAGMTRGRRDGILKSEKMRHVVKIGPMHLKGVWFVSLKRSIGFSLLTGFRIPFERALDFANKEKITELLYPLFVHNIGALLYHPTNSSRTNAVMAAAERRKLETKHQQQGGILGPPGSQPPSLHHHHSMQNPIVSQPPHSIAPHPGAARPGIDRAHTFPTPPTSASSVMGMSNQGSSYDWGGQNMSGSVQGTQPLSIDTGLSNARSVPTTPATTPPSSAIQNMHPYQGQQPYDSSRPMYSSAPQPQGQYASQQNVQQQNLARFGQPMQPMPYLKNEMGPPSSRAPGSGSETDHSDHKNVYAHGQGNEQVGHGTGEEEAEHEHDSDYAHENNAAYNANRGPYAYNSGPALGPLHGEHPHLSPEMTGSSPHQNGSGRGTPRVTGASQPQWAAGYHTPPRAPPSSNLYNVVSDARGSVPNGNSGADGYASGPLQSNYPPSSINGVTPSNKRMREDDDADHHQSRPASRGDDIDGPKRVKKAREGSVSGPVGGASFDRDGRPISRTRTGIVQQQRRR